MRKVSDTKSELRIGFWGQLNGRTSCSHKEYGCLKPAILFILDRISVLFRICSLQLTAQWPQTALCGTWDLVVLNKWTPSICHWPRRFVIKSPSKGNHWSLQEKSPSRKGMKYKGGLAKRLEECTVRRYTSWPWNEREIASTECTKYRNTKFLEYELCNFKNFLVG